MAEYVPLTRQQPVDDIAGVRASSHLLNDSVSLRPLGSLHRGDSPSEGFGAESYDFDDTWTSPTEFIERSFNPSIDLSTLATSVSFDRRRSTSNDTQLPPIPQAQRRKGSAYSWIQALAASRQPHGNLAGRMMWNPIWLTRAVLVSFVVLFIGLFAVALALYLFSTAHHGLLNGSESFHYIWTYLPTAIFVLTTSFWRQVDFYCKELTPYSKMKRGPVPATQSILLDYITPMLPKSLWQALRHRHWAVAVSIVSYLMIHLCTVLSAGLFVLSPVQMSKSTDSLVASSKFSAANLNVEDVTAGPVDAVYGVKAHGLLWTYGTTENLTVQTFDYAGTEALSDPLLTAQVPGFGVTMDCVPAQVGNLSNTLVNRPWGGTGILAEYLLGDVSGPDCQLRNVSLGQTPGHMYFTDTFNPSVGWKSNYQGFFDYYVCNTGFDYEYDRLSDVPQPNATSPEDYRLLLTVSNVTFFYNGTDEYPSSSTTSNWTIARSTAVLCKPSYSVDHYNVTLAPLNRTLLNHDKVSNTSTELNGFTMKDFLNGIVNSLSASDYGEGGLDYLIAPVPSIFMLLEGFLTALDMEARLEPLMHSDLFRNLSIQALQGIGTQFAEQYLKQAQGAPLTGSFIVTEQRLQVRRLTVGLLLTTLGLLAGAVLLLVKFRPWNTTPCPTESLASAAILLAASDALRDHLRSGDLNSNTSVRSMGSREYHTEISPDGRFAIQPTSTSSLPRTPSQSEQTRPMKDQQSWWRPMTFRRWYWACVLLVPLLLIAALEVIQQVSDNNDGITALKSTDSHHLIISYIPVTVMLLVAMTYASLNSTASVFAPFLALHRRNARAARSMSTDLVSKLQMHALYLSLRHQHWANVFTISAALVSSFLTIVTSGLYSPVTVQASHALRMQQTSVMNLSHVDLTQDDNVAGETTKLMTLFNLSSPIWTYDDLVFPTVDVQIPESLGSDDPLEGASISTKLPALRPSLRCTVAPTNSITNTINVYHSGDMELDEDGIFTTGDPGSGVFSTQNTAFPWSLATSNTTQAEEYGLAAWSNQWIIPNNTEVSIPKTAVGVATPVVWEAYGNASYLSLTVGTHLSAVDVDPLTPTFGFAAGYASGTKTNQLTNVSWDGGATNSSGTVWHVETDLVVAVCYQILEEVHTNVTFDWPSMSINQSIPPLPDESTARVIMSNETSTSSWIMNSSATSPTSHWFGITLNTFLSALQDNMTTANWLDAWFTTLQNGKGGQPLSELLGQANQDKFIRASSRLYSRYAVQAIHANMRISEPQAEHDLLAYNGTLLVPVVRLKQNKAPKIALQVLLGTMAVCGLIAWYMLDTKEVLRQSPCSIAGKMELLAKSELCNSRKIIPEGAELWDEGQRRQHGLFDGWLFRLDWWGEETMWYGVDVCNTEKIE